MQKFKYQNDNYPEDVRGFLSPYRIFNLTQSEQKKQALENWIKKVGPEKAEQIKNDAIERGRYIDQVIQDWFIKDKLSKNLYGTQLYYFLDQLEPLAIESNVWDVDIKAKGRLDCLAEYNGEITIIDWKGSDKNITLQFKQDEMQQLVFYGKTLEKQFNIKIQNYLLCFISSNLNVLQPYFLGKTEVEIHYQRFVKRVEKAYNLS